MGNLRQNPTSGCSFSDFEHGRRLRPRGWPASMRRTSCSRRIRGTVHRPGAGHGVRQLSPLYSRVPTRGAICVRATMRPGSRSEMKRRPEVRDCCTRTIGVPPGQRGQVNAPQLLTCVCPHAGIESISTSRGGVPHWRGGFVSCVSRHREIWGSSHASRGSQSLQRRSRPQSRRARSFRRSLCGDLRHEREARDVTWVIVSEVPAAGALARQPSS